MWTPTKTKKYGVAIYNWRGDTRYGLPLEIGDTVQILEECTGWYRGFTTKNRANKGIFPQSYVFLKPCKVDNEGLFESVVPVEDPVIREVTLVLREWGTIWKKLYVGHNDEKVRTLLKSMRELLEWRRQLMSGTLTHDQTRDLKLRIIQKIDCGNRELDLDLVPRQGAQAVDPDAMSIVELYQVHVNSAESSRGPYIPGLSRRIEPKKVLTHHLYFCMRDFGYHIGEDTEIYFSLYDSKKQKYISERFLVKISKEGFSNYVEKLHSNCSIFTDLGNADLSRDLYLITHVLRIGRMLYSESSKRGGTTDRKEPTPTHMFRRPHAVAALNLAEMISPREGDTEEKEFTFKVFQTEEKDFHQLHDMIIKQNGKFTALSGQPNYGIVISLKMLHGELSQVREENPLLFKNTQLTRKLGFADVIMPGDVRNDLYLVLEHGDFERGGKSTGKNIEVTITVLDNDGRVIDNCLWGATGMEGSSTYNSMIIYHHNSPWWSENIRLTVPIDRFSGSHVRLEYRHCSTREKNDKKLFGFSFIRLMGKDGATVQDGQHELYIYKCEDVTRLEALSYLALPSHAKDTAQSGDQIPSSHSFSRSHKEMVFVRTLLCSTKLTQNVDLLSLLQWKTHPTRIQESLQRVLRLGDEELVKFLQDVLDALFALFSTEDGNSTQHSGLVFHVLVSIFSLLDESKFQHFKPVMDAYIKGHFAAALVYKGLLSSVQHCSEWVSSTEKQEPIQKCFRSLEYIFKLIIQSRILFARATGGQFEDSFKRDLYAVLNALNKMLASSNSVILPTQMALLQSMGAVYEQLTGVLPTPEVTRLAAATLDALPNDIPPQLTQAKLSAIRHLVTTSLFHDDESRNILLNALCRHLRIHLARRDELRLCTDTLADIISFLYKQRRLLDDQGKVNNCIHHDIDTICINTLDMLIQTVLIIIDRSTAVSGALVACLIGLLQLLDEYHYTRLWEDLMGPNHDRKPLKDFLLRVFLVFRDLVKQQVFPSDWLVIRMAANNVMLRALQELAQPLAFKFLDSRLGYFDNQLWSDYFNLAVAYLTQQSLQLEHFSEVKREKIIEKYGDMRVLMGFQILSMWSHLGEHKLHFIPSMVGPYLEVTLVPEWELRKATLHIFFDMMECEQNARGNFKQVEAELIDKLDILISENKGDDEYKQLFNTMLLDRVEAEDPVWKDSGTAFISSVTRLLERLLDYRNVIQGDENRDKRMSCTVNLLKFYKNEINRKEMYLRYIHKLHDLHIGARNYTEAGCTMLLYADQLSWNNSQPAGDPNYPGLPECQLKLNLYHKIIDYFDTGKCWEKGIPLLKELAILYETREFNYTKLGQVLKLQAQFFDNILKKTRLDPEYFRVGFYGLGFPLFVRNKLFIYRGEECEKIGDFTHRLLTEFPCAHVMTKISTPDDSIVNSDEQYIQIYNVKPIPEPNPILSGTEIPEKIARFYYVNEVRRFRFDRVVHKGLIDKDNEFKSQWKERTTYITESSLPGILKWFEVIDSHIEELAPVQVACDNMRNTVGELRILLAHCTDKPDFFKQLSMKLKGIIVPEVQGGLVKYQQAFFTPEFTKLWPDHIQYANDLRNILRLELLPLLEAGLARYGRLAPAELQPLHTVMCQGLAEIRYNLGSPAHPAGARLHRTDSIINTPLPPLPIQKHTNGDAYRQNNYSTHYSDGIEDDSIYTKPLEITTPSRESLTLPMNANNNAPPIPQRESRPRSQGFNQPGTMSTMEETVHTPMRSTFDYSSLPLLKSRESLDSGETIVPPPRPTHHRERSLTKLPSPKLPTRHSLPTPTDSSGNIRNSWPEPSNGEEAPPLPPRGQTPDKRGSTTSLENPPNIPRRLQKKSLSVFNAESVTDSFVDLNHEDQNNESGDLAETRQNDLRDSGISTASLNEFGSTLNNLNNLSYEDFDLRTPKQSVMNFNISPPASYQKIINPPPIPPKNTTFGHHHSASLGSSIDLGGPIERRRESDSVSCLVDRPVPDNYSIPRMQLENNLSSNDSTC